MVLPMSVHVMSRYLSHSLPHLLSLSKVITMRGSEAIIVVLCYLDTISH